MKVENHDATGTSVVVDGAGRATRVTLKEGGAGVFVLFDGNRLAGLSLFENKDDADAFAIDLAGIYAKGEREGRANKKPYLVLPSTMDKVDFLVSAKEFLKTCSADAPEYAIAARLIGLIAHIPCADNDFRVAVTTAEAVVVESFDILGEIEWS